MIWVTLVWRETKRGNIKRWENMLSRSDLDFLENVIPVMENSAGRDEKVKMWTIRYEEFWTAIRANTINLLG